MAKSLAVKYRPQIFEEMCGQKSIIHILKKQVESNNIKNCYLFCGSSGIGKTTIARSLANLINNNRGIPIELDAASNNGVDNVRSIIEEAQTRAIDAEYKVFIIDEAHAITSAGWQAFLKTLEEPPKYSIFMFCTTNPEKIPDTIQNRVLRFNLTKIPTEQIISRLKYICNQESFTNYEETCDYIAKISNGGMRDAIVALEKVSDYSTNLAIENTLEVLGTYSYESFLDLTNSLVDIDEGNVIKILDEIESDGKDLKLFVDNYMSFILDLDRYALLKDMRITKLPLSLEDKVKYAVSFQDNIKLFNLVVESLLYMKNTVRYDTNAGLTVKALFIKLLVDIQKLWTNKE